MKNVIIGLFGTAITGTILFFLYAIIYLLGIVMGSDFPDELWKAFVGFFGFMVVMSVIAAALKGLEGRE